jgi:hypothetical protein
MKFYNVRHFTIGYYVIRYIYATRQVRIIYQVQTFLLISFTMVGLEFEAMRKCRTVLRQTSLHHLSMYLFNYFTFKYLPEKLYLWKVNSHSFTHGSSPLLRESIFNYRVNNSSWLLLILSQIGPIHFSKPHLQPTYAKVPRGFLYHLVTCYIILYPPCSPPVTSSCIWINELMYDEYLLYSDITQRALRCVTPSCYDAGLLMNIQHRTNLSINICRFPHNIYTTVILKLNSLTVTHFSLSSRDSWRTEHYYNSIFEIFTALFRMWRFVVRWTVAGFSKPWETIIHGHVTHQQN